MTSRDKKQQPDIPPVDHAASPHGAARDYYPEGKGRPDGGIVRIAKTPATYIFFIALAIAWYVGQHVQPTWVLERVTLDVQVDEEDGSLFYVFRDAPRAIGDPRPLSESHISPAEIERFNETGESPATRTDVVVDDSSGEMRYYQLTAQRHYRWWSLLPALVAVALCWTTREPLTALFGGVVVGAFILARYDITDVLISELATTSAAGVLLLYLWLLGGLMGLWSRTGAAKAFAQFMSQHFVRGPKTAKLVAWMLGVIFFQGGTVSAVLVGTTVKPLADEQKVSHEELSYVVDSTSSPIAGLIAFNAWPGYIQAFLFVPGVAFLATDADRLKFFFSSIPFSFYCLFAVIGTFLFAIDKAPYMSKRMKVAIERARSTGQLNAPGAISLASPELEASDVPEGYKPHIVDFLAPLLVLLFIAIFTFVQRGSPQINWAFGIALLVAMGLALARGMTLLDLMAGYTNGLKGVVLGSVILLLAITVGAVTRQTGAGIFMVELLGDRLPFWTLPVLLQILTVIIAFSTGTSWGTYAVTFPLAMPLAWAVAEAQGVDNPMIFLMICFAAVLNGSIYGDQCSPISDTTVLSSMCTGADLMDHVKTQMPIATAAALLAAVCWTGAALLLA